MAGKSDFESEDTGGAAPTNPFDLSAAALERAYELAVDYVSGLPTRPVSRGASLAEMAAAMDEPLPEHGCDPAAALESWFARAEPGIVASSGPRFFGFVNGGTTPAALAGDWLASAIDQNTVAWIGSPAGAQTEQVVLRWLKELFGIPGSWDGALTSGATMSNLVGLAAARQWAGSQLGFDPAQDGLAGHPPIPVISSTAVHASVRKALATLGLGRNCIREVPATDGAIDLEAFGEQLAATGGPVIVIANAGEVNTGRFDPIDAMADLCRRHPASVWLHVDGAFGLFAAVSPRLAHLVRGVGEADSIAVDAHKWLNVPYDSGAVFVRDVDALRSAFAASAAYIAPPPDAGWDPASHGPEMSRRFRGLAAWCALKAYGREGYRALVERCVDNAEAFAAWVDARPGMELMVQDPPLNIVPFRYVPPGLTADDVELFNEDAVAALQRDGRAFVTGTVWNGQNAIRAAFDNWATHREDVAVLRQAVMDVGDQLLGTWSTSGEEPPD